MARMAFFNIIIGFVLLLFGRRLFWLLVAVSGFMVGFQFSQMLETSHLLYAQGI